MTDKEFDQQLNNWFNQDNSKNSHGEQQSQEHNVNTLIRNISGFKK